MGRAKRRVIAINVETGERREYDSVYECGQALDVSFQAIQLTLDRRGVCKGWKIYDTPEKIREIIGILEEQLNTLEK